MSKIKSLHITEQNMPHRHANNRLIDLGWYFKANNGPFGCVYKGLKLSDFEVPFSEEYGFYCCIFEKPESRPTIITPWSPI